eukprot:363362-Chlamydomonas_euryale.AAC.9
MCRGRRSRPIMPAEAEAGLRPRTSMYGIAQSRRPRLGLRPRAFTYMHVQGQGPVKAEAGVIGRDRRPRQTWFVQG